MNRAIEKIRTSFMLDDNAIPAITDIKTIVNMIAFFITGLLTERVDCNAYAAFGKFNKYARK